ncbi:putative Ig domain-containing protein [Spirosoma soli]|uniref:Ig domain-containing protein n=1 Tax=Spirosoma soli TaxID=1770529 RepID=A0ABW5LYB0_9BACT
MNKQLQKTIRTWLWLMVLLVAPGAAWAQVSFTSGVLSYTQNFNNLANTGSSNPWTDNSTIIGWYSSRTLYLANNGNTNTGGLYSFGADATDRSLGSLGSGSANPVLYGVQFINNTGNAITSINVQYKGEQWRKGANPNSLTFSYKVGATSITESDYTSVGSLSFTSPQSGTVTPLNIDGNSTGGVVSATIPVTVNNGQTVWLRWSDVDDLGADAGLAIDDLTITATTQVPVTPTVNLSVSTNTATEADATVVTVTATASAAVTGDQTVALAVTGTGITTQDYILSSATITIPNGTTSGAVSFTVANDALAEGTETAVLTISSPSSGLVLGSTTTQNIAITDNDQAGFTTLEGDGATTVTEGGATDTYTIALNSQPTANVIFTITPDAQVSANPLSLTFTAANYSTPQTVTVTAVDDAIVEGNHTGLITQSVASADAAYNGLAAPSITVNITDNDVAQPVLTANPTTLAGFTTTQGTTSAPQVYSLTGSNLTSPVAVSAPAGFQVSLDGTTFQDQLTVPLVSGGVSATVAVRLTGASTGSPSGSITNSAGSLTATVAVSGQVNAPSNSLYYNLAVAPFTQDWTNTGLITTNDNWSGVQSIIGYRGDELTTATGTNPQTILSGAATPVNVIANQTNPNTLTAGGVAEFQITNPSIGLQGSGTADAPHIVIYLNTTNQTNINVAYNVRDLDGSGDNAIQQVALQYRIGESGNFINIPEGYIGDATSASAATQVTPVNVTLPAEAENQSQVQLRIITSNAVGNDEWVGIDDIVISGTTGTPTGSIVSIQATDANAAETAADPGVFTITRTGSTTAPITVNYVVGTGTGQAINGTDYNPTLAGTVALDANQTSATITVTPVDDALIEGNESVVLSLTTGEGYALSGSRSATVVIADNDVVAGGVRIHDIQGASHVSPLATQTVTNVPGVVTTLAPNGFYMEDTTPDADPATSEGIFVFTSSAPSVAVGTAVLVSGTVAEFRPGNNNNNLSITQISNPTVATQSVNNTLPNPTVISSAVIDGARRIPTQVISNDFVNGDVENSLFDPAEDGLDFFESLEGMRVQINNPVTTGFRNDNGEVFVIADNGNGATGKNARNTITISGADQTDINAALINSDFNPERILIDDLLSGANSLPNVNVGAVLSTIVGVVTYDFQNYRVLPTIAPTVVTPNPATKEITTLTNGANQVTIATFNVENLDPGDPDAKFSGLASAIATNLKSPDIIVLEEIQDNNGAGGGGVVDASQTFQKLINFITAANGPTYQFRQINPVDGTNGGEGGGNIRVGFLFNPARVSFVDRPGGGSTTATTVTNVNGNPQLSASPGLIDPTNSAFSGSRKPLVGEFTFNGQTIFVIGNHFTSRGGSGVPTSRLQPPAQGGQTARESQAAIVNAFVDQLLAINPSANIAVMGDFNEFQFFPVLQILKGNVSGQQPVLVNLITTLPAQEQYTYNFDGNAQALDHFLASNSLFSKLNGFDVVHINSEFLDQLSDHDPSLAQFTFAPVATPLALTLTASPTQLATTGTTTLSATVSGGTTPYSYTFSGPGTITQTPASNTASISGLTAGVQTFTVLVADATSPASQTISATVSVTVNAVAAGNIQITEFMYDGNPGEYVELTNVGNAPVDMTGWSFDDNSRAPGSFSISGFGIVQPGESVIISEASEQAFRTAWYLPGSVKVVGGNTNNLGRSDEINIYDNTGALVDRLTYNDQSTAGLVRTQNVSAWTAPANLSATTYNSSWVASTVPDVQNSYSSVAGNVGNPGGYFIPLNRVLVRVTGANTAVTEGGTTDTYTVALNSQPTSDVTVTINPGSQLTVNPSTLTFTPSNYSTVQTVTVTAVDDAVFQGAPRSVTITQSATSADVTYNGIAVNPVSVTITDNDVATTAPPTIQAVNATPYINLPANGPGYVSGVIGDPTDPASTLGVSFTLTDTDTDVNSLTVTASSSTANATVNLTGTGSTRNLKITPAGVGYSTITVTATDGSNVANYVINYASSAGSNTPNTTRFHTGVSDASTAILVDNNYMFVADDENQVLRLYNRQNSGLPVSGFDFTSSLGLTDISGGTPREVDIEASIRRNNRIFWLGSISNADGGNLRPNRDRIFATDVTGNGAASTLSYVGRYDFLREDIINWDVNNGHGKGANYYGLQASAADGIGAKQSSAFNLEGAEFAPDDIAVYLGFRAPQVLPANRTKALIIPVTNLTSLVSGQTQGSALFGAPIELDLGGRGIREIRKNASNQYVIIAGPAGDATGTAPSDFRLFTWTGNANDAPVERNTNLTALNANGSFESIVELPASLDDNSQLQLLVDNGDAVLYNDGTIAKELAQNNFKKFRSDIVSLGSPVNTVPTQADVAITLTASPDPVTVNNTLTYTLVVANSGPASASNVSVEFPLPSGTTFFSAATPGGFSATTPAVGSGGSVTFTGSGAVTAGSSATFTVSVTPTVANAALSATATVATTVSDPNLNNNSASVTTVVNPVAATPLALTLTASPTQLLTSGTTTLSATVSGGTIPYSYAFSGPGTITPNGNSATVSSLTAGVQTFTVLVSDATNPTSQTITGTVSVTVTQANIAPTVATTIPPQSATVGQAFSYVIPANTFADANGDALTLTVTGLPQGLSFNGSTTAISGTPTTATAVSVTVVATDPGSLSVSTTFSLTVSPAPVIIAPLALTLTASPSQLLTSGMTTLSATVSGGTTPYSFSFSGPGTISPSGNTASVSGLTAGVQTFTLLVSDATSPTSQTLSASVSVTVSEANTAPTTTGIPNQTATVGQSFSLDLATAFSDAQTPNSLTLSATGLPAGLNLTGSTLSGTASQTGTSTVTVTATDPGSLSASTSFTLTVLPQSMTSTAPFAITGVTTLGCTPVGDRINLSFTPQYAGLSGAPVSFSVVNELLPTTQPGPYSLSLYSDNPIITLQAQQAGVTTSFVYNWLAACQNNQGGQNTPPTVLTPVANQTATQGQLFSLNLAGTFTDQETPTNLTLSASGLPQGLNLSGSTLSGTASQTGTSTVTLTATDPGSLSVSTSFTITVLPQSGTATSPFAITGVTTLGCTPVGDRVNISFTPQYAGLSGAPVSFSVVNELLPTTQPGPYSLSLYSDNPVITLQAQQAGVTTSFVYNWLAACQNNQGGQNTPPTVATPVANQTATQGQFFSLNLAGTFTDQETPTNLTLSASGLPQGLNLTGSTLSGTASVSGVSTVTLTATDPGSLSASTSFTLTVLPQSGTATSPFAITGVSTISCTPVGDRINLSFTPQYAGLSGAPVSFSVVNELLPTTQPGPYSLSLYSDNPVITLQAQQAGVTTSFVYNWLTACNSQARVGAKAEVPLTVTLLGNPVHTVVEAEVTGAEGNALRLFLTDAQGRVLHQRQVERAGAVEKVRFSIGNHTGGVLLLRATMPGQSQTVRVLKAD